MRYCFVKAEKNEKRLSWEGLRQIEELQAAPFYLFSESRIKDNIEAMRECLGEHVKIAYAMKANPWLAKAAGGSADYVETCSEGELLLCETYGIPAAKIFVDGIRKNTEFLKKAVEMGITRLSINSFRQMETLSHVADGAQNMEILLRMSSGNQFGMAEAEAEACVRIGQKIPNLKIAGIHYYPGTQRTEAWQVKRDMEKLERWVTFFESKCHFALRQIEFGAGVGMPYFTGEDCGTYEDAMRVAAEYAVELSQRYEVTYETGRNLAATCGIFITKIFETKEMGGKKALFCLGGTHQLKYHGGILGARAPHIQGVSAKKQGVKEACKICGELCSESDVLAQNCRSLDAAVGEGDYLVFHNAGAYAATESKNLFLCMEMPGILIYNKDNNFQKGIRKVRGHVPAYRLIDGWVPFV